MPVNRVCHTVRLPIGSLTQSLTPMFTTSEAGRSLGWFMAAPGGAWDEWNFRRIRQNMRKPTDKTVRAVVSIIPASA